MTPLQLERRERLLDAVIALVAEGHDDEMQMKDIADRAGVALGTVYRYFSSKDHLVAAALVRWAESLEHVPPWSRPSRPVGRPARRRIGSAPPSVEPCGPTSVSLPTADCWS